MHEQFRIIALVLTLCGMYPLYSDVCTKINRRCWTNKCVEKIWFVLMHGFIIIHMIVRSTLFDENPNILIVFVAFSRLVYVFVTSLIRLHQLHHGNDWLNTMTQLDDLVDSEPSEIVKQWKKWMVVERRLSGISFAAYLAVTVYAATLPPYEKDQAFNIYEYRFANFCLMTHTYTPIFLQCYTCYHVQNRVSLIRDLMSTENIMRTRQSLGILQIAAEQMSRWLGLEIFTALGSVTMVCIQYNVIVFSFYTRLRTNKEMIALMIVLVCLVALWGQSILNQNAKLISKLHSISLNPHPQSIQIQILGLSRQLLHTKIQFTSIRLFDVNSRLLGTITMLVVMYVIAATQFQQ